MMSIDDVASTSSQQDRVESNPSAHLSSTNDDGQMHMDLDEKSCSQYVNLLTLQGFKRGISALSISPDGQQLVSADAEGLLKVWSLATGAVLATLDAAMVPDNEQDEAAKLRLGINDVAWSRDGRYLVCGGDDCMVRVWNAITVST